YTAQGKREELKTQDWFFYSPSKLTRFSPSEGVYHTGSRNSCRGSIASIASGRLVNRNNWLSHEGSLVTASSFRVHSRICLMRLWFFVVAKATVMFLIPK